MKILSYKARRKQKFFLGGGGGHFPLFEGYNIVENPNQIYSCRHFKGQPNFMQSVVHEIWKIMQFCHCKAQKEKQKMYL